MKKVRGLCLSVFFMVMSGAGFAETPPASDSASQSKPVFEAKNISDEGVHAFKDIMKSSPLYALLVPFNATVPDLTKVAQFVMVSGDIRQMNHKLDLILAEFRKTNGLMEAAMMPNSTQVNREDLSQKLTSGQVAKDSINNH